MLLAGVEWLATVGEAVPLGRWVGEPGPASLLGWFTVLLAAWCLIRGGATRREAGRRAAWGVVAGSWIWLAFAATSVRGSSRLTLDFLDVGQGDAIAIRTPRGRWVIVDAGPAAGGTDAGRRVLVPHLRRHGARRVDLFVLSHAHRDHVGGAAALARAIPVTVAIEPGVSFADEAYLEWLRSMRESGTRWRVARAGEEWMIDSVAFRVLHPAAGWEGAGTDLNEDSIVLEVRYGGFVAVLTGDAGIPSEAAWSRDGVRNHAAQGRSSWFTRRDGRCGIATIAGTGRRRIARPEPVWSPCARDPCPA